MIEQPKRLTKLEKEALARKIALKAYQNPVYDQDVTKEMREKFEEVWDKYHR